MSEQTSAVEMRVRRVRRTDLHDIVDLLKAADRSLAVDRAGAKRFRNIVGDLGCDFDVTVARERVCGFVHITYVRDLLVGNRAQLMALIGATQEVRQILLERAVQRALRRRCRDVTVLPNAWVAVESLDFTDDWRSADGCRRLDLEAGRRNAATGDLPAGRQTC
jgi:hypothetical protein